MTEFLKNVLAKSLTTAMLLTLSVASAQEPDPRGPVPTPRMRVVVDQTGVQTTGYSFTNRVQKPTPWQGQWIWLADPPAKNLEMVQFRKEFVLPAKPGEVAAWLSADVIYRLYVNGRLVSRGPADIGRDYDRGEAGPRWLYDYRDLTPFVHAGTNVIAAEVFTSGFVSSRVSRGHGFLFEASIATPGQPSQVIKSDATWRAWPGNWRATPGSEEAGWKAAGFKDHAWLMTAPRQSVWLPLAANELPPLMEARYPWTNVIQSSTNLQPTGSGFVLPADGSFSVQFDRVISAYPSLKFRGGAGGTLTVIPGEIAGQRSRVESFHLDGSLREVEYPYLDSFSVLKFQATNLSTPLEILDAGAVFSSYPVAYKGSFDCSDPELATLWRVSRWLTQICMQTHHLDSPNHQEPICDPGDYLIESLENYYAFGEPWLARQDLRKFAGLLNQLQYRNFHTSYALLWLQMLMAYYDYTGDPALVLELAPDVHGLLDTFTGWRGTNGLISEAPNYMFMDWVTIEGFGCHHPPAVIGQGYMTAFYYQALADAARVAGLTGDKARMAKYEQLRKETALAFNRELWHEAKGLYRDGKPFQTSVKPSQWLPADKNIETFSTQGNLLAVLYDLAPKERQGALIDQVMARTDLNTQPYFMFFLYEALRHAGRFEKYALPQMRRLKIIPETQTYREMWQGGDFSHAWGGSPLIEMSSTILGVTPLKPGFLNFEVHPRSCGLSWARGTVPTPHGNIEVTWSKTIKGFDLDLDVPPGCRASVVLGKTTEVGPGHHEFRNDKLRASK